MRELGPENEELCGEGVKATATVEIRNRAETSRQCQR